MRLLVALSTVAMIGLSSSAMGFETARSQISSGNLTQSLQSLEVRQSTELAKDESQWYAVAVLAVFLAD